MSVVKSFKATWGAQRWRGLVRARAAGRYGAMILVSAALVVVLAVLHLTFGTVHLSPLEVVAALVGRPADPFHQIIVWDLRMPRTLIAMVTGAMLALSGALLQAVLRNPLAEPEMTGATSGAMLAAVLWLAQAGGAQADPGPLLPLIALLGGLAAGGAVYLLGGARHTVPVRLILTGLLVSAILRSVVAIVLLLHTEQLGGVVFWLIGSLNGRVWVHWDVLWPYALVAVPLGLACMRWANLLQLGDASAVGLGLPLNLARAVLLFVATLLAAGAVAIVGGVAFLGLIAPHIARRLTGADARRVFPLSMLLGAGLMLAADIVAQVALQPTSLPVGTVLAVLGAPFFLYLLRRSKL